MSRQNIMWTALPNGLNATGDHLKLSVLVSPRLVTNNGVNGALAEFPDFLDWPKVVGALSFHVEFEGGPSFTLLTGTEPGYPSLDSATWTALFRENTPVRSYAFDDRSNLPVRSYPTRQVLSFLTQQYTMFAVQTPTDTPSLTQLGFSDERSIGSFGDITIDPRYVRELDDQLNELLRSRKAVSGNYGNSRLHFYQVQKMHEFLSTVQYDANGHRLPLPAQKPPDVDFHNAVAAMGQYPKLMRALGLAIDLEVPLRDVPAASNVRVTPNLEGPLPLTPWTAYQFNSTAKSFLPLPAADSDVSNGMLSLTYPDTYDVVEMDVDGAANKAMDFALNMSRIANGDVQSSIDTPQNYGLPSLRSAGFSATRVDRAVRLVNVFAAAQANNTQITSNPQNSAVVLHAEDVTRGYRVDVWSSLDEQWHSLCLRDGTYHFLNTGLTRHFADEGFVTVATTQSADGTTTDLRLPESLFRWTGWSLCARRPGRTVGSDSTPQDPGNPASTDFKLETAFTVTKGTLPRLRFLAQYQFRARAVDLAGNSLPYDAVLDESYNLPPQPIPYLRYEPVIAPALVLRTPLGADTTPGESVQTLVIRSNYNTHISGVSERHIAPPKTSVNMAETHGMLDTPAGLPDKTAYALLASKDGDFGVDPAHPDQPVPHPEKQLVLPYLPDPFAIGAAFRTLPGTPDGLVWQQAFTGTWPDTLPFRLALDEGRHVPEFKDDGTERVLTVHLPKAEVVTVALSSYLTDDPTTNPPTMLSTMQLWSWIVGANPPDLSELQQLALNGGHWMLTPPKLLTLVHAVQQPLIEPQFQHLTATRQLGETFARLTDEFPISGKSTIKVDIEATWQEPIDDPTDTTNPQPVIHSSAGHAFGLDLAASHTVLVIDQFAGNQHEFHDTRHRNVTYTALATTRFREFFPTAITSNLDNITRRSQPVTISIPSAARPAAPKVQYVLPSFGWQPQTEGTWTFSRRGGGGLRVYLDRPWFLSGEGELLGVVLWSGAPPAQANFQSFEVPDSLKSYVTQWGMDPIWTTNPLPYQAVPQPESFSKAVKIGIGLSLDELNGSPPMTVAGHTVAWDQERNLWYCDIVMEAGDSYFPFVRLALARYQPDSIADTHLSRVVLADFAQLLPDRSASIMFDPMDADFVQLAVTGLTYQGPGAAILTATLQTQPVGSGDQAWVPLSVTTLDAHTFAGPDTLWAAKIKLSAMRGSRPFRLVIEEFETFATDVTGGMQTRLVYADILNL